MRIAVCLLVVSVLAFSAAVSSAVEEALTLPLRDHRVASWMLPASPSVCAGPVSGLFNPAGFAFTDRAGLDVWWDNGNLASGLDNFGFAGGRNLNFSVFSGVYDRGGELKRMTDYQIGLAKGRRSFAWGLGYRWSTGGTAAVPRQKALAAGFMARPSAYFSLGASSTLSLESDAAQHVFDLGFRPLGSPLLTLFGDVTINNDRVFFKEGSMAFGVELRPVRGLHLGFRARERVLVDEFAYSFLVGVSLNDWNVTGGAVRTQDLDRMHETALVRTTAPYKGRSVSSRLILPQPAQLYSLSLENRILTYQKSRFFDDEHVAWLDLLEVLDGVRRSPEITVLAVNLAGFRARPSLAWEFRQQLELIRRAGKQVVIHADRLDPAGMHLASVADRLSLDPQGIVVLPGTALSRSYLAGTLEKLGLGFQEHRYFKYKSAAEALSRTGMSEADREQRQRIVDVIYETLRAGTAAGRGLTAAGYDRIVDEMVVLTAGRALAAGLADTLCRWDQTLEWAAGTYRVAPAAGQPSVLRRDHWDERWGSKPRIPVVYAVGACAMDEGIKGRATSAYLRSLVDDPSVKAVVLRADSPGGDPLPSDLVADAVRRLRAAGKPVIVSQGDVAASGGYWISMDATEILTTPLTITGSVGVISGWLWDAGLAEKMGVTSDSVQRGAHADLRTMVNLPFLGSLPRRGMTPEELEMTEALIREMYAGFVGAVAAGRGLPEEKVEAIAEGRVWMGQDAVDNGLCDRIGTLDDAIRTARELAGIPADRPVELVEYPPRPLIKWPSLLPKLPPVFGLGDRINTALAGLAGIEAEGGRPSPAPADPASLAALETLAADYLRIFTEAAGAPVLLTDPDLLPEAWRADY